MVGGALACSGVTVEVFEELMHGFEVGIGTERGVTAVVGANSLLVFEKESGEAVFYVIGTLMKSELLTGVGRVFYGEFGSVVFTVLSQSTDD